MSANVELAALLEQAAAELRQRPPQIGDVIDQILRGQLLTLDQAGDIAECSDEKLRKQCVLTAATDRPMGIKIADRWFVSKARLLDDLEQGKIDRRRGPDVRRRAEECAKKYEGWARSQKPLLQAVPAQEA
jgi:hypothetical protein